MEATVKHLLKGVLVLGALVIGTGAAYAAHQPMAMGAQQFELAAKKVHHVDAYCLDHDLTAPTPHTDLDNVSGAKLRVCRGADCRPLQEVVGKWVRVRGTDHYGVTFENLTTDTLSVDIGEGSVVSDAPLSSAPTFTFSLPTKYDGLINNRIWRELKQVDDLDFVSITSEANGFTIRGSDGIHDTDVLVLRGVREDQLGTTLAKLSYDQHASFEISSTLAPDKLRAMLHDVRLQAANDGMVALVNVNDADLEHWEDMGQTQVGGKQATVVATDRKLEADFEIESAASSNLTVGAQVIVEFHGPVSRSARSRAGALVVRAIERLRGKSAGKLLDTAADVRTAVNDEMHSLQTTLSSGSLPDDTVWVMVGNIARGYVIVQITVPRSSWEG